MLTNNEKMIELYGRHKTGYCWGCKYYDSKKCHFGGVKVNKNAAACGKYEAKKR